MPQAASAEVRDGSYIKPIGVAFRDAGGGREILTLGRIDVGEIMPAGGRWAYGFRLLLPDAAAASRGRYWPAADLEAAQQALLRQLNEWLVAADVTPNAVLAAAED